MVDQSPGKRIEIIAGPNGSGKSSFAELFLTQNTEAPYFINSDVIASGISPRDVEKAAFQAGRVMLSTVKKALTDAEAFAFESTLSGKSWLPLLREAQKSGYSITIYFIYLKDVRLNLKRIQARVKSGGHHVPAETVRRRFPRCFENFWNEYRPLCKDWFVFENSGRAPEMRMSKARFETLSAEEKGLFQEQFLSYAKEN